MNKQEYELLKAKFLKLFANVPRPLRKEIIVLVNEMPLSWDTAYGEVQKDTKEAKNLLYHLKKMEVLK